MVKVVRVTLFFATAAYAVLATLYVIGAVASGLPAGASTSATVMTIWFSAALLVIGTVLYILRRQQAAVVLRIGSLTLASVGFVLTVEAIRHGVENLQVMANS